MFVAHELEGRSFREIATATGVSVNTLLSPVAVAISTGVSVNTLLSRKRYAVLRLRERLQSAYHEFMNL
ncbi:MAG TPA: hypothetical protein VFA04_23345 [Bryobacteraceae bacterium]|nr:hypothetical protein [Bryobacteraceae bacterium]